MKRESRGGRRRQLDLMLPAVPSPVRRPRRPCTRERAAWWFDQMRRAVDGEMASPDG